LVVILSSGRAKALKVLDGIETKEKKGNNIVSVPMPKSAGNAKTKSNQKDEQSISSLSSTSTQAAQDVGKLKNYDI
jgi:hypothetical protein